MANPNTYKQVAREYTDGDRWRHTTYEGTDGHRVSVVLPPRKHMVDYGNGRVFLDHLSYDDDGEATMLASLVASHAPSPEGGK